MIIVWSLKELEEIGSFYYKSDDSFLHFTTSKLDDQIIVLLQGRNGKIFSFEFDGKQFRIKEAIASSSLTFCRLSAHKRLIAFPSLEVENSVDLYDFKSKQYILKGFTVPGNGMCMFTKFHVDSLLVGFETGRLCRLSFDGEVLLNELLTEDSCNDALILNEMLFAVGASNKIVCWQQKTVEVPFPGFSSIVSDGERIITAGWDAK